VLVLGLSFRSPDSPRWLLSISVQPALAAGFVVAKTADTNDGTCDADCSLREAITAADAAATNDTITFAAGANGTTTLGSALPVLANNGTADDHRQRCGEHDRALGALDAWFQSTPLTPSSSRSHEGGGSLSVGGLPASAARYASGVSLPRMPVDTTRPWKIAQWREPA
jgi:CSLREA domain-containing protein